MARFLIEVPHEEDRLACTQAVRVFLETGSHFLKDADWGCFDGEHKAWIILELESKEDALSVVPPAFRPQAKIVKLNKFTPEDIGGMERQHRG
jgi:hypothetical protein